MSFASSQLGSQTFGFVMEQNHCDAFIAPSYRAEKLAACPWQDSGREYEHGCIQRDSLPTSSPYEASIDAGDAGRIIEKDQRPKIISDLTDDSLTHAYDDFDRRKLLRYSYH